MRPGVGGRPRVVLLELGRPGALGATRRLDTWRRLWQDAGASVDELLLLPECPARARELPAAAAAVLRRPELAWESLAWSWPSARARLEARQPDVVVCTTVRCHQPDLLQDVPVVVLDLVDRLSENYRRRAAVAQSTPRRVALSLLSRRMRSVERRTRTVAVRTAAGRADAAALSAVWVPNVVDLPPATPAAPDCDALFVGTLDYAPNVDALHRVARAWPQVLARRPGTSLLVAGARPGADVRALVAAHGWQLAADFPDLGAVCARARVSLAPVALSTGMQNKVLETAARGLPQLLHPTVLAGLDPAFPAVVADDDDGLARALAGLLDDPQRATALGQRARRHVAARYSAQAWSGWCAGLLEDAARTVAAAR